MNLELPPSDVRTQFDIPRNSLFVSLGSAGGFSGASFWQVETIEATYCLRRWPKEHPSWTQLEWIHRVLLHCANNGCPQVESVLKASDGSTLVSSGGHFWQLTPWMPGSANYNTDPNDEKLNNAISTLARFHLASAQISLDFRPSPAIQSRLKLLSQVEEKIAQIKSSTCTSSSPALSPALNSLRQLMVASAAHSATQILSALTPFESSIFPIQPIIRDIWHDHVLFTNNEVTGIVDFGAMTMDTVCLDLSRLTGSLVGNDDQKTQLAMETYSKFRTLTDSEQKLIEILDDCSLLLGSLNWLTWIFVEQRKFDNILDVENRVNFLLDRLTEIGK